MLPVLIKRPRKDNLLHVVPELLSQHDNNELERQLIHTATGIALPEMQKVLISVSSYTIWLDRIESIPVPSAIHRGRCRHLAAQR